MGRRVTSKDCRFMVTNSEMKGIQGWFLRRLGCFSIDQSLPSLKVLRHAVNLIAEKNQLVVFPEGKINKYGKKIPLKEGLYRLALLAGKKTNSIYIIPIGIAYSQVSPKIRDKVSLCFGDPLLVNGNQKLSIKHFNEILNEKMHNAEKIALENLGR
jgi:1-acyl-sn-glycerol-3-phosphate acyltransferase